MNRNPSRGQSALWLLEQTTSEHSPLNVSFSVTIRSALEVTRLRDSFALLHARHPALRTSFHMDDGQLRQCVASAVEPDFELVHAGEWPGERVKEYLLRALGESFDLASAPLLRARLVRRAPEEHLLLITAHHTVVDFRSLVVLLEELGIAYAAQCGNERPELPPTGAHPADHARWQRALESSTIGGDLLAHWQRRLADSPPPLELPSDRRRPAVRSFRGRSAIFDWDDQLADRLRSSARSNGVTMNMLLLAGFLAILHRYSGERDIFLGTSVDGRNRPEFDRTVGYLVNQVVLRSQLDDDMPFLTFLERVKSVVLDAIEHQDLPFPLLVEKLQPQREAGRAVLFQVMFMYLNTRHFGRLAAFVAGIPDSAADLGGLEIESLELPQEATQFELTVMVADSGKGGLTVRYEFDDQLFDAATIGRMNGNLRVLLEAAIADPTRSVETLPMLTSAEREQLISNWSRGRVRPPAHQFVHEAFQRHAQQTPDAVAVTSGGSAVTYGHLNERANRLANHLSQLGAGPDTVVGICIERSVEMIVALLGVLKAGAAYLPLEPTQPIKRLALMLGEVQAKALVVQEHVIRRLPAVDAKIVRIDTDAGEIASCGATSPQVPVGPEDLAYVIYTSGSTGRPKGVMITHGGLANYLRWAVEAYEVADGCGAPLTAPIGFDATVTSLFAPLVSGVAVDILDPGAEITLLTDALQSRLEYSFVKVTPAHLDMFADTPTIGKGTVIRRLVVGGDALSAETVGRWQAPGTTIFNEYGPTETVVGCCVHDATTYNPSSGLVPIGRPIDNTEAYILDRHEQPVPIGVIGELYIGGAGVARGYLNQPELTARAFLPHPFTREPGARLYKTGDFARFRVDGDLEFHGRADGQVKIRGHRVELSEIEGVLQQHPQTRGVAVKPWSDPSGQRRLAAFVVWSGSSPMSASELRQFLQHRLPIHMIPSVFISLERLPLTSHGKVDRATLRIPTTIPRDLADAPVTPSTGLQRLIAGVWREVLQVDRIGIRDNFFDLGGDSMLVAKIGQQLSELLDREVSMVDLMQFTSIETLADHLATGDPALSYLREVKARAMRRRRDSGTSVNQHRKPPTDRSS